MVGKNSDIILRLRRGGSERGGTVSQSGQTFVWFFNKGVPCQREFKHGGTTFGFFHLPFVFSFLRAFKRVFFGGPSKKTPRTPPYQVPTVSGESLLIF
jgi:hypothetical protein